MRPEDAIGIEALLTSGRQVWLTREGDDLYVEYSCHPSSADGDGEQRP